MHLQYQICIHEVTKFGVSYTSLRDEGEREGLPSTFRLVERREQSSEDDLPIARSVD